MQKPWHAPGSARPRDSQPVSLSRTWSPLVQRLHPSSRSPASPSPRLSLIVSPYLLPVSSLAPSVSFSLSQTQPVRRPGPRDPTATPPRAPRPRVSRCHWLRQGALVTAPCRALTPPASWQCRQRRLREGTGWGHCHPPPDVPGALGWGRASSRGARVPAPRPGPGPPGARPDGLHGELGVLRGAGTRAPLQSPAPRESPVPGVGPGLGTRGFSPRRKQAAPASGRALREWVWGEGGRQSPAHLRQVRSHSRKVPVSDWEVGSKGRLPQGGRLN